jgi:hypothetical protein
LTEANLAAATAHAAEKTKAEGFLAVRFETLVTMSERTGTLDKDPAKMGRALRQLAPTADEVEQILAKHLKDLTWTDARAALNVVGISVVKGVVNAKVTALLKIVFPFRLAKAHTTIHAFQKTCRAMGDGGCAEPARPRPDRHS